MNEKIKALPPLWPAGSTAVRRDVFAGRSWTESPNRVLSADGRSVTAAIWPGVRTLASTEFIASKGDADAAAQRLASLDSLADGSFELGTWTWRWTALVTEIVSGRWFSISRMYAEAGPLACWYVNFERPPVWRPDGWDTMDLAVDLVVEPDGRWRWKDEDEYAHCRRLGLISAAEHAAVARAREQAVDLVERRAGVFAEDPAASWLPDPAWPRPVLG